MSRAYISIVVVILALSAQVQQHVVPRRKSSTYSCASCFRRLQQRTGETSIISAHENQAFPMTTFVLRLPKTTHLSFALPSDLRHKLGSVCVPPALLETKFPLCQTRLYALCSIYPLSRFVCVLTMKHSSPANIRF
ncbi:hypothetical protein EDB85DRAFT_1262977 [Lactarius pseudohatsudake]|nr:hypothetical protein EDB85DRAFT_1262977 [Lactarius pseudohatsudake]